MTRDELAVLLLGEKSGDLRAFGQLLTRAARLDPDRGEPILAVSNTLWAANEITIRDEFAGELAEWVAGSVRPAPFQDAPEQARELINSDVAETTRGLIAELVPYGAIAEDTVAALVNALYLKCAWRNPFDDYPTRPRPFHAPGGTIEVPTMELSESIGYAATGGWQVVSLPAAGGVRAVVLLPDGDLATAEPALSAASLAGLLDAPKSTQVRLRLPKVDVAVQAELTSALHELGVRTVFTDDADLSGISPNPLAVQAVLHQSVLKLDEHGLEGAAATAMMIRVTSMPMRETTVDVDRPFLLVIQHAETGVVYFLARVVTPG